MTYLVQFLIAMTATLAFAVLFAAPKRELPFCGLCGALAWLVYLLIYNGTKSAVAGTFAAAFVLTIVCRTLAVARQKPATVYLVCAIFPLVPGAGVYYTVYDLITGQQAACSAKALETFELALAVVFGIIFGFSVPEALFHRNIRKEGRQE